jgi:hypothetical protein
VRVRPLSSTSSRSCWPNTLNSPSARCETSLNDVRRDDDELDDDDDDELA